MATAVLERLRPTASWQFELNGDWQPFTVGASAAVEARYASWADGVGPCEIRERSACGRLEYIVNFATMTQQSASTGCARTVRREETYDREAVHSLAEELVRERRVRLAAEAATKQSSAATAAACAACGGGCSSRSRVCGGLADEAPPELLEAAGGSPSAGGAEAPPAPPEARPEAWRALEPLADRLFALATHRGSKRCEISPLEPRDPRRQWLEHYFRSTLEQHRRSMYNDELCARPEVFVTHVLEVYNANAVESYRHELNAMRRKYNQDCKAMPELERAVHVRTDLGGNSLNEVLLFHGTTWSSCTGILNEGFDSRLHGQHAGAAFGAGTYFTPVASKADFYTKRLGDSNVPQQGDAQQRVMIVGRVALGEIYEASQFSQSLRRPPANPEGLALQPRGGTCYDSVLGLPAGRGGVLDFPEAVVYKSSQAVPQFVICYKHELTCQCRTCAVG